MLRRSVGRHQILALSLVLIMGACGDDPVSSQTDLLVGEWQLMTSNGVAPDAAYTTVLVLNHTGTFVQTFITPFGQVTEHGTYEVPTDGALLMTTTERHLDNAAVPDGLPETDEFSLRSLKRSWLWY